MDINFSSNSWYISCNKISIIGIALNTITIPTTVVFCTIVGVNLAINKKYSRKLFEAIKSKDLDGLEENLNIISEKSIHDKKYIFNNVRDKNGNTLITSIIKSNKLSEEKKIELIGRMIDNGTDIFNDNVIINNGKKEIDNRNLIEIAKNNNAGSRLINFLNEKYNDKLNNLEENYNEKLKIYEEKINNCERRIEEINEEINKKRKK